MLVTTTLSQAHCAVTSTCCCRMLRCILQQSVPWLRQPPPGAIGQDRQLNPLDSWSARLDPAACCRQRSPLGQGPWHGIVAELLLVRNDCREPKPSVLLRMLHGPAVRFCDSWRPTLASDKNPYVMPPSGPHFVRCIQSYGQEAPLA